METIDFICANVAIATPGVPSLVLKIPKICCGIETKVTTIVNQNTGLSQFVSAKNRCDVHLGGSYSDIWGKFGPNGSLLHMLQDDSPKPVEPVVTGHFCVSCNLKNEYAVANQKDGTYVCFECRT